jgi:hypothetical protein
MVQKYLELVGGMKNKCPNVPRWKKPKIFEFWPFFGVFALFLTSWLHRQIYWGQTGYNLQILQESIYLPQKLNKKVIKVMGFD